MFSKRSMFDAYDILATLGGGDLSVVYHACQHTSGQEVVIKVWPTVAISSLEDQQRIRQEFETWTKLKHPSLVPILDSCVTEKKVYVVSEYTPHGSLASRIATSKHTPLDYKDVLHIIRQIGQALSFLHQHNLVHGNLTPKSVLFDDHGKVLLSDFFSTTMSSITKSERSERASMRWYMAPELAGGKITARTDQYALGCLAYELFTGQVPFSGLAWTTLKHKHRYVVPVDLLLLNPALPLHVGPCVLRALEKKPALRYPDVQGFLGALDRPITPSATRKLPVVSSGEYDADSRTVTEVATNSSPLSETPAAALQVEAESVSESSPEAVTAEVRDSFSGLSEQKQRAEHSRRPLFLTALLLLLCVIVFVPAFYLFKPSFGEMGLAKDNPTTIVPTATSVPRKPTASILTPSQPMSTPITSAKGKTPVNGIEVTGRDILPTPTPTLAPAPTTTLITVDDSVQGSGLNQFNYVGSGWGHCISCDGDNYGFYNNSYSWDDTPNDYVTITFNGTQIKFYGVVGPVRGIGAFSLDGGAETQIDFYAANNAGDTLLYSSPPLAEGQHTLKVRVTGDMSNPWSVINLDRVDIVS